MTGISATQDASRRGAIGPASSHTKHQAGSLPDFSIGVPCQSQSLDPIFAAIEAHKAAQAACERKWAVGRQAQDEASSVVPDVVVPNMKQPGEVVTLRDYYRIEDIAPRDDFPEQYSQYRRLFDKRCADVSAIVRSKIGADLDDYYEDVHNELFDALEALREITPTTTRGLLALIVYVADAEPEDPHDPEGLWQLITSLSKAAKALQVQA
ncbi:hypothetical protein [Bradyrhizobium oligotrophicum]|uniref:hypothetical protein n=1 Tax=Bradyrhizobium oligotrophicum TaxID=44255 RepID=UPI003EBD478B